MNQGEILKRDVFPLQQACNSLSLTINGSSQEYRPNECLRDLMISQVHKDAIAQLGQPVFEFSDQGYGVQKADGTMSDASLIDPGVAYGREEMQMLLADS